LLPAARFLSRLRKCLTLEWIPGSILLMFGRLLVDQKMLRSGKLAQLTRVSTDLLRHYERIGVLPPPARTSNGYRIYAPQMVARVRAVRRSVALGFSLAELSRIFAVRDRGGIPCRDVRALAGEKLHCVEQSLTELKALRRQLQAIIRDWDCRLARTSARQRAGLLESLADFSTIHKSNSHRPKKGFSRS
jgi:MerR family transcriptional regulator, copper efflux regulator